MSKSSKKTICQEHNCSWCCSPVKMKNNFETSQKRKQISHWKRRGNELYLPAEHPESVRLETYDCDWFDRGAGLCKHYEKRPDICRKTKCAAFGVSDKEEQKKIIEEIKIVNLLL